MVAVDHSLTKTGFIIDAVSFQMNLMLEHLDKHTVSLDMAEQHIWVVEDEQVTMSGAQKQLDKMALTLQSKTEDLEARSHRSNLRIMGLAKSTEIDNMEKFMEKLYGIVRARAFFQIFSLWNETFGHWHRCQCLGQSLTNS
ncbi:hypothetical protein NDU88_002900 [Pleurodeles waltl]|uniref:Uncharacterized protein n=1 Tax=Pleurodeles waltl TaxID=8319 RepID=A0AAV7T3V4_PLEWA|nr:hypothetical protein NDU88_002900 [Pleurodeles waltl]